MANYHLLGSGGSGGFGADGLEDSSGPYGAAAAASHNTPGAIPDLLGHQQPNPLGSQMAQMNMGPYQTGAIHGYTQNEMSEKYHLYNAAAYGHSSQVGSGVVSQYLNDPRYQQLGDPCPPTHSQQPASMTGQAVYQNLSSNSYGQRSQQSLQGSAAGYTHYGGIQNQQYQYPSHSYHHYAQAGDMWSPSMGASQHSRSSISTGYAQHQSSNQHSSMNYDSLALRSPKPMPPSNQNQQYMPSLEYGMLRTPQHSRNSSYCLPGQGPQNGPSSLGQASGSSSSNSHLASHSTLPHSDQPLPSFSQGPYGAPQTSASKQHHYNTTPPTNSVQQSSSQNLTPLGVRPMGYPCASSRINSGQHVRAPGSPARLMQYPHSFSPSQSYSNSNPSSLTGASTPPQHMLYGSGTSQISQQQQQQQQPISPHYRGHFPPQVTHSPRQPTATPPAGSPMPHTPERMPQPSTPHSQGSYPSPSTGHSIASPSQGLSPASVPSNSLQHLEQMVIPRGRTSTSNAPASTVQNVVTNSSSTLPSLTSSLSNSSSLDSSSFYSTLPPNPSSHPQTTLSTPVSNDYPPPPQPQHQPPDDPLPPFSEQSQKHSPFIQQSNNVTAVTPPHTQSSQPPVQQPPAQTLPSMSQLSPQQTLPSIGPRANNSKPLPPIASPVLPSTRPVVEESIVSPQVSTSTPPMPFSSPAPPVEELPLPPAPVAPPPPQLPSCPPEVPLTPPPPPMASELPSAPPHLIPQTPPPFVAPPLLPPYQTDTYEIHQLQQELHHLYSTQVLQDNQQKIDQLQERLHYLQQQPVPPVIPPVIPPAVVPPAGAPAPNFPQFSYRQQYGGALDPSAQPPPLLSSDQEPNDYLLPPEGGASFYDFPPSNPDNPPKKKRQKRAPGEPKPPKGPRKPRKSKEGGEEGGGGVVLNQDGEEIQLEPKKPKKRKPKDGLEKEPKVKKPRKNKSPKESKVPKENQEPNEGGEPPIEPGDGVELGVADITMDGGEKPKKEKREYKKRSSPSSKENKKTPKKRLPKISFKFGKKKKRKRLGSSENSDMEKTPPPSPEDDSIQKRRSARNTHRKKYTDDIELHLEEVDLDRFVFQPEPPVEAKPITVVLQDNNTDDTMLVERVLASRTVQKEIEVDGEDGDTKKETIDVEEFFVKYKNLSYLHCEWKSFEELEKGDRRAFSKIKKFRIKRESMNIFDFLEEEPFNPEYVEVDRVLDMMETVDKPALVDGAPAATREDVYDFCDDSPPPPSGPQLHPPPPSTAPQTGEDQEEGEEDSNAPKKNIHYLVKWRGLSYEESTWELEEDVDPNKIRMFHRFRHPPPKDHWKCKKRPRPQDWSKLEESPVYKGDNTLREYQLEGVNWLTFCWYNSQNCILADEMGLGKTIQSIAFLQQVVEYGISGPFLVIAPLSTISNWQREFETWTDINAITYHGSSQGRHMIQEYEMYYKKEKAVRIAEVYKFQVLITTFEIVLSDCMDLREIPWKCCIIDEAHRLKNKNCKLLEGLRLLDLEHRVLLTGTPLQNNVEELFSLLNFLEPNRFASTEAFMEEFGELKSEGQVHKLKAILKPMMLRRLKEDVEKSLAPKEETVIEVELTNIQKKYYRAILERNFTFLTKGNLGSNIPNLMNTMMELRKCCLHPFLINGAEEQITNDFRQQQPPGADPSETILNALIQSSGKLVLIDKLLPRLHKDGHRVLVFSQMVRCLDILEDYLIQRRYRFERIDGRVRGNLRQAAIDRFCKPDSDRFVFLLCTRAGGLGINLTAADTVIIFDSDWNPQNDLQAQARCHRIGQSKMVKVYRLICRNTYEREMFDKASLKLGLDKAVLQAMNSHKEGAAAAAAGGMSSQPQLSKKEIEDLLRKGAYGALMEDDNAGDKFCEEDIDQILERRTHVITLESEGKGSTFAKATFSASSNRSDIEINDPNFWEKWAKKANLDLDELKTRNDLIVQEPRRRTQTRRFGADDTMLELTDFESSDEDEECVSNRTRNSKGRTPIKLRTKGSKGHRRPERDRFEEYYEEVAPGNWTRPECFKVEKGLLTFGWGRWDECLVLGNFTRLFTINDVEEISRIILLYCLLQFKGEEKLRSFIWELISPGGGPDRQQQLTGLGSSPRRSHKPYKKSPTGPDNIDDWAKEDKYNAEVLLTDDSYKKHLVKYANRILLRVRLLYYIRHEIIGSLHEVVISGAPASTIPISPPPCEGEPPVPWWDSEADKSLLIGIDKHGYGRYNVMRQDPSLIFLSKCGPPDGAALLAEMNAANEEDLEEGAASREQDPLEEDQPGSPGGTQPANNISGGEEGSEPPPAVLDSGGKPIFPSMGDLNTRVRKLISGYQRNHKKEEIRLAQNARRMERKEKNEAAIKEREQKKQELQQRKWSRREEADFYRTVSSYGVERQAPGGPYDWNKFRSVARLERKFDDTLTDYFRAFLAMCKKVCNKTLTPEEETLVGGGSGISVEAISEDRASRCLQRLELLTKLREEMLPMADLESRLQELCQPSMDLPDWWQPGVPHDRDLLVGASRHGLARMDFHLLHDPDLAFRAVVLAKQRAEDDLPPILKREDEDSNMAASEVVMEKLKAAVVALAGEDEDTKPVPIKTEELGGGSDDTQTDQESFMEMDLMEPTVAQLLAQASGMPLRWPKDKVLQLRLEQVMTALEKNEWPVVAVPVPRVPILPPPVSSAPVSCPSPVPIPEPPLPPVIPATTVAAPAISSSTPDLPSCISPPITTTPATTLSSITPLPPPLPPPVSVASEISPPFPNNNSSSSSNNNKLHRKRRRRRRNEIEAERAKLRVLLSQNMQPPPPYLAPAPSSLLWKGDGGKEPSLHFTPPPPAHQNSAPSIPPPPSTATLDLSVKAPSSPVGSPIDLSAPPKTIEMNGAKAKQPSLLPTTSSSTSLPASTTSSTTTTSTSKSRPKCRIDALALNLQRKQQQLIEEQQRGVVPSSIPTSSSVAASIITSSSASILPPPPITSSTSFLASSLLLRKPEKPLKAEIPPELTRPLSSSSSSNKKKEFKPHLLDDVFKDKSSYLLSSTDRHHSSILGSHGSGSSKQHCEDQQQRPKIPDPSPLIHQDFKKWLDEHPDIVAANPNLVAAAMSFNPLPAHTELLELPDSRRRGRRPRLDPTKIDLDKITGEENVSVINRVTGKKITGIKAPPLKHLAAWLEQNPMFDVDAKWSQLVREKGNLPESLQKRIISPDKRGRRTASSLLSGATTTTTSAAPSSSASLHLSSSPAVSLATSLASYPPTSHFNPLTFASPAASMLAASFPSMKFFGDPTPNSKASTNPTSPLFLPFGGLAGMGITSPLFGFPNPAVSAAATPGFNFQGLSSSKDKLKESSTAAKDKSSLPFLYPNPTSLLYNPLFGLPFNGGLPPTSLLSLGSSRPAPPSSEDDEEPPSLTVEENKAPPPPQEERSPPPPAKEEASPTSQEVSGSTEPS